MRCRGTGMGATYFRFSPMCSASLPLPLSASSHALRLDLPCLLPPWAVPSSCSSLSAASQLAYFFRRLGPPCPEAPGKH